MTGIVPEMERQVIRLSTVSAAPGGEHAAQRAALLFALVAGFQVMRQMIGLKALAKADGAVLERLMSPLIEQLMAG